MEYIIKVVKTIAPFIIAALGIYLLGSFISVSFNPVDWTESLRMTAVINVMGWGWALWFRLSEELLA